MFFRVHLWRRSSFLVAFSAIAANAQAPDEKWRTITTPHFFVHFAADLEPVARRAGGSAERAYAQLMPLIRAPKGRIDLVVTDHADFSNGYAYVSPSPRMVVFARPPVDDRTLRFRDDWLDLVIQHELVHVFHLDRTRGWWRAAQALFGRQPLLFPNAWAPSWMLEGLAVYYESTLGDGGRLEGLAHVQYANALAIDGPFPHIGQWSVATLAFPDGATPYVFGSLFMREMVGRGPAGSMTTFIEKSSARFNPFAFDGDARRAFGVTFSAQYAAWRDSLLAAARAQPAFAGRALTSASWYKRAPRLTPDGRVLYVASDGRDVAGLYELSASLQGPARRIARRNSLEPNVALGDGRIVFAQSEWTDPWRLRTDLWMRETNGREHPFTRGARLFAPDARARDGAVLAVQNVAGTTRLVRVGADGAVTPITSASIDTNWSAPRWSHDGARIAATRWVRGGTMSIVVLDTLGAERRVLASARATVGFPSWTADDRAILFAVNNSGASAIWKADVESGRLTPGVVASTSLDAPEATADGYVAVETRGGGERLVASSLFGAPGSVTTVPGIDDASPPSPPAVVDGEVKPYRALRQLVPRYWLPSIETTDEDETRFGALISGSDIVGRHFYAASLTHEPTRGENTGSIIYRFSGLGLPFMDVAARQQWDHTPLVDSTRAPLGSLLRRRRFIGTSLTLVRARVRNSALVSGSAELELRDFSTDPAPLVNDLGSPLFLQTLKYPTFTVLAGWENTRAPILALGPEDGIGVSGSARLRWRTDDAVNTRSVTYIGALNTYKSLGFIRGPAHHVLALRGVIGVADDKTNTELQAGGVSGSTVELAPGLQLGDVRRNFFVRGFAPGAQRGIRALGGSFEYRAPVSVPSWGSRFIPFFAQRVSATFFGDAGAAWCPAGAQAGTIGCPSGETVREWMTSVGGELTLDAAVLSYDVPYRLRLGFARPVMGRAYADHRSGAVYFSLGATF